MYLFKIYYTDEADNSKIGSYVTLNRDQQKFKIDEYIDITEEVKTFTTRNGNREWQELMIKPVFIENNNNEGRNRPTN
jgi:L-rhamnose mutarotase